MTNSLRTTRATCNRKFQIAYEYGIRPEHMAKPLRMGDNYHQGHQVMNMAGGTGCDADVALAAAVAEYNGPPAPYLSDHDWGVERETVLNLLNGYVWRWGPKGPGVRPDIQVAEVLAAELPFDVMIEGVRYCGKIDAIVRLGDGRVAVLEYKTTQADIDPGSDYWLRLRIDSQISGYVVAGRMLGFPIETVLYDVTCKPGIKPKQVPILDEAGLKIVIDAQGTRCYKDATKKQLAAGQTHGDPYQSANADEGRFLKSRVETPVEFGDRLRADIAARPEIYYARQEVPRLDRDLALWKKEIVADKHFIEYSRWRGVFPRNTSACVTRYTCEFFKLCQNGWEPGDGLPPGFRQVEDPHQEVIVEGAE